MNSIWKKEIENGRREQLTGTHQTRVVVIGAGMAGMLTAYLLQEAGLDVLVLEAETIASGQTAGTTAKITSQHGMVYEYLTEKFGVEKSRQYAGANEAAIQEYERIVKKEHIACDFRRCPSYLYALEGEGAGYRLKRLEKEIQAAAALGIKAEFTKPTELPFPVAGAELFPDQACFHPLKFLEGIGKRLKIYEHSRVQEVKDNCVFTGQGLVEADSIVFTVHYPWMVTPGWYFLRMHQERSYVTALRQEKKLYGMYRDMEKEGLSFRSQGEYLLLGGEGHRTGKNKEGGSYKRLKEHAGRLYPGKEILAAWSAQDCITLDRVPYIGYLSAAVPNWFVATGFGKWGMTGSMASAMILRDMILGKEHPQEDIFSPQRMNWKASVPQLLGNVGSAAANLSKRLWPFGEKKACRHMGCALSWNPEESTWDCPCHGSRYTQEGELLDEPSQKPLKKEYWK